MEYIHIPHLNKKVCRIGLGTWAIGGWLWGGTDEKESIATIHHALDLGINLIDTAPIYGLGRSEEIIGKAIKSHKSKYVIATKVGIRRGKDGVYRDARKESIIEEVELSLMRFGIDQIDLYQVHWPDLQTPFEETAEAMHQLLKDGKIGAIGVSNFTSEMMEKFRKYAPLHSLQSPYNIFETEIDKSELPYCKKRGIIILGYGTLCRGLLSGRMHAGIQFKGDDLRKIDPKFQSPHFEQYLACIEKLKKWAQEKYQKSILLLALRWSLDQGIDIPLWGARHPEQLDPLKRIWDWKLTEADKKEIKAIIAEMVTDPVGPEFMMPSKMRLKEENV